MLTRKVRMSRREESLFHTKIYAQAENLESIGILTPTPCVRNDNKKTLLLLFPSRFDPNRRSFKPKGSPNLILEETLI